MNKITGHKIKYEYGLLKTSMKTTLRNVISSSADACVAGSFEQSILATIAAELSMMYQCLITK